MSKVLISVAFFLAITSFALAQDIAAVDPNAPIPEVAPVVDACEIVAAAPELSSPNGPCITATRAFLSALAIPSPAADLEIQGLVVALLELSQLFPTCDIFDSELAAAIREAAAAMSDPELRAQLLDAATAIEECVVTNLGAIAPLGSSAIGVIPG
jgi:hypothetical protein